MLLRFAHPRPAEANVLVVDSPAFVEERPAEFQVIHPRLLRILRIAALVGLEGQERGPQVLLVGPTPAEAERLLDRNERPLLIHDMARRRPLIDVFERKRPPAQDNLPAELADDMIQPRRGQISPRSVIFVKYLDDRFFRHFFSSPVPSWSIIKRNSNGPASALTTRLEAGGGIIVESPWRGRPLPETGVKPCVVLPYSAESLFIFSLRCC